MNITIDENLRLELIEAHHAQAIFELIDNNRNHLRKWLTFIDRMPTVEFVEQFCKGTMQRNIEGIEFAYVLVEQEKVIGRIGIYKIDNQNKIGEIGYWMAESAQGKGIMTKSCKVMIDFCFAQLHLNRIEIKCATDNLRSIRIPEKLNFTKEGIIRQGEFLNNEFIDLNLYSLLRIEF